MPLPRQLILLACLVLFCVSGPAQTVPVHHPHATYYAPPGGWEDMQVEDVSHYPDFVAVFGDEFLGGENGLNGARGDYDQDGEDGTQGEDGPSRTIIARTVFLSGRFDLSGGRGGNGGRGGPPSWKPGSDYCGIHGKPGNGGNGGNAGNGGRLTIICENLIWHNVQIDISGGRGGSGGNGETREGNCVCLGSGGTGGDAGRAGDTGQVIVMACNRYPLGEEPGQLDLGMKPDPMEPRHGFEIIGCPGVGGNGGVGAGIRFGKAVGRGVPGDGGNATVQGWIYMGTTSDDRPTTSPCFIGSGIPGRPGRSAGLGCEIGQLDGKPGVHIPREHLMEPTAMLNPYCNQVPVASFASAATTATQPHFEVALPVSLDNPQYVESRVGFTLESPEAPRGRRIIPVASDVRVFDAATTQGLYLGPPERLAIVEPYFDEDLGMHALHFTGNPSNAYGKAATIGVYWRDKRPLMTMLVRGHVPPPAVPQFSAYVTTEKGMRHVIYHFGDGEERILSGSYLLYFLGAEFNTDEWFLLQVDLEKDIARLEPDNRFLTVERAFISASNIRIADFRRSHREIVYRPGITVEPIKLLLPRPLPQEIRGTHRLTLKDPLHLGLGEITTTEIEF